MRVSRGEEVVVVVVVVIVVVVVEWFINLKEHLLLEGLTLAFFFFSLIFVCKMCVFVSRPVKSVTFLRKNGGVVDFPLERDTFRNEMIEIVKDFDEKSYNNNGKPWKSSRILRLNPFFHFSFFLHHFSIFHFFHFFVLFIVAFFHFFLFFFIF